MHIWQVVAMTINPFLRPDRQSPNPIKGTGTGPAPPVPPGSVRITSTGAIRVTSTGATRITG